MQLFTVGLNHLAQFPGGAKPPPAGAGSVGKTAPDVINPLLDKTLQGKSGLAFFQSFFPAVIGMGFVVGVIIFFFYFLWGAISWIMAGGDKANIEAARGRIVSALAGLIVLFSMFAIIKAIEFFFADLNILTIDIGPLKIQ